MTIEARIAALNLAASIHKETTAIVTAAQHFAVFLIGEGEAVVNKVRGRKASGEAEGKAQTVEQIAATNATATVAATATAAVTPATTAALASSTAAEPKVVTQPTLQQVADKIIELANSPTGGRDKAVAILTKFKVKKVPELKPEDFAAVLDDVAAANAPVLESLV